MGGGLAGQHHSCGHCSNLIAPLSPFVPHVPVFQSKKKMLANIGASPITVEWCYQGDRIQLHIQGDEVRAFGSNLEERTEQLGPQLTASICKAVQGHSGGLIIDAIIQGLAKEKEADDNKVEPPCTGHDTLDKLAGSPPGAIDSEIAALQAKIAAVKRMRREKIVNSGPRLVAFDLLWDGEKSLMGYCLKSRREQLRAVFKESPLQLTLARSRDFPAGEHPTLQSINTMMQEAVGSGVSTGLVFKCLHSPYEAGRRSGAWQILGNTSDS